MNISSSSGFHIVSKTLVFKIVLVVVMVVLTVGPYFWTALPEPRLPALPGVYGEALAYAALPCFISTFVFGRWGWLLSVHALFVLVNFSLFLFSDEIYPQVMADGGIPYYILAEVAALLPFVAAGLGHWLFLRTRRSAAVPVAA